MPSNTIIRRLLLTATPLRTTIAHSYLLQPALTRNYSSSFPIAEKSFWTQLIPKPFRRNQDPNSPAKPPKQAKPWNPGTFYIWIFLLIGSMAIQMIALRIQFQTSMNRAEAKIGLLKEVIEKVQKGEEVDVDGLLGRGSKAQEDEWEQVLREAEKDSELFKQQRTKAPVNAEKVIAQEKAPNPPEKTPPVKKAAKGSAEFF